MMETDSGARLRRIEDQLAIYQVIAAHPCAVDGGNADALGQLYTEDGVYAVGESGGFEGRAAIQAMATSPMLHDLVAAGAGHVGTLPYVVIDGDRAVATGHGMLVLHGEGGFRVARLSAARYQLERNSDGDWQIVHRALHLLDGDPAGPAILGRLMEAPARVAA
jgi:uncharacterized protein (TIGR02246 family)